MLAQLQPSARPPPANGTADCSHRPGRRAGSDRPPAPRGRRLSSDSSEPEPLLARSPARTSATSKACPVWLCGRRRCDRSPEDGREGCDADPGRWGPPAFGVLRAHGALSATGTPGLQAAGNATGMSVPSQEPPFPVSEPGDRHDLVKYVNRDDAPPSTAGWKGTKSNVTAPDGQPGWGPRPQARSTLRHPRPALPRPALHLPRRL